MFEIFKKKKKNLKGGKKTWKIIKTLKVMTQDKC